MVHFDVCLVFLSITVPLTLKYFGVVIMTEFALIPKFSEKENRFTDNYHEQQVTITMRIKSDKALTIFKKIRKTQLGF